MLLAAQQQTRETAGTERAQSLADGRTDACIAEGQAGIRGREHAAEMTALWDAALG